VTAVDWKTFYREELATPTGRAAVDAAPARHADGDAVVVDVLRGVGGPRGRRSRVQCAPARVLVSAQWRGGIPPR
jgi:hypothetical protein